MARVPVRRWPVPGQARWPGGLRCPPAALRRRCSPRRPAVAGWVTRWWMPRRVTRWWMPRWVTQRPMPHRPAALPTPLAVVCGPAWAGGPVWRRAAARRARWALRRRPALAQTPHRCAAVAGRPRPNRHAGPKTHRPAAGAGPTPPPRAPAGAGVAWLRRAWCGQPGWARAAWARRARPAARWVPAQAPSQPRRSAATLRPGLSCRCNCSAAVPAAAAAGRKRSVSRR